MITLAKWLSIVKYTIHDSSDYLWNAYGKNVKNLNSWNGKQDGWESSILVDTETSTIYQADICDYKKNRAYRIINPDFVKAHAEEVAERNKNLTTKDIDNAWENTPYIDLDVDEDFMEKLNAIVDGKEYDDRVMVTLDFNHDELFMVMKAAHEEDVTLNQFISNALSEYISNASADDSLDLDEPFDPDWNN